MNHFGIIKTPQHPDTYIKETRKKKQSPNLFVVFLAESLKALRVVSRMPCSGFFLPEQFLKLFRTSETCKSFETHSIWGSNGLQWRKMGRNKLSDVWSFLLFLWKYVWRISFEAPGTYSDQFWFDKISILICEGPKPDISMISEFPNPWKPLFMNFRVPKLLQTMWENVETF